MLQIKRSTDPKQLQELASKWRHLLASGAEHSFFQLPAWHSCWWKSYAKAEELNLLLAYRDEALVGVLPLVISEKRVNGLSETVLEFLGAGNFASDYCLCIAADDSVREELFRHALYDLQGWSLAIGFNIPETSKTKVVFENLLDKADFRYLKRVLYPAPKINFTEPSVAQKLLKKITSWPSSPC